MPSLVIIAGCGGGYDVFGGIPLYLRLKETCQVTLVNYSFTDRAVLSKTAQGITPHLFKVEPTTNADYTEALLARELGIPVYALAGEPTIQEMITSYQYLLPADTIYLVDGGCDVLLTGTEDGLGTPVEDIMHLAAVQFLPIPQKYITAVGVSEEDINATLKSSALLSSEVWDLSIPEVKRYHTIVARCHPERTVVQSLICAALDGHRGFYLPHQLVSRLAESTIPLSIQTCTMYLFSLQQVYDANIYVRQLGFSMTVDDVDTLIMALESQTETV